MRHAIYVLLAFHLVAACASQSGSVAPDSGISETQLTSVGADRAILPEPQWIAAPRAAAYETLPGWDKASILPGLNALRVSCKVFTSAELTEPVSSRAPWLGTGADWQPACAALDVAGDAESARTVMQALFLPLEVNDPAGRARFTAYFEPMIEASRVRRAPYTEPVPARPSDLVEQKGRVYQRDSKGRLRAYPERREITRKGVQALAYARPEDVFFLQIQGSGRLKFPDGQTLRAAYAANNGQPFRSTANWLIRKGWIQRGQANMAGIKAWMRQASERQLRTAMNANPRYVFFRLESVDDITTGPKGAFGVPLTPLGSMAVDPAYHALGLPMFVETKAPGLSGQWSGLVVAQDTGGAIKGPVRGDLFIGSGQAAGEVADTVNAAGRLWVLLPRRLAEPLLASQMGAQAPGSDITS